MDPSIMWVNLACLLTLMSVSYILLSTTPTATTDSRPASTLDDPRLLHSIEEAIEEAAKWIVHTSESVEKKVPGEPCDAPPSLSYLRSHIKHLLVHPNEFFGEEELNRVEQRLKIFANQLLIYSFYIQNVFQPYRSQLTKTIQIQNNSGSWDVWDTAVCLPNSDTTTEGRYVSCKILQAENGTLKNTTTIAYLNDTCHPSYRGRKRVPLLWFYGIDTRYLRWFLESSFVLEKKKVGDNCTVSPELGTGRAYLDVLMWNHFGKRNNDGNVGLTTPGKEGKEDEIAYEAAKADVTDKRKEFFEEMLNNIVSLDELKDSYEALYCSMKKAHVCMDGSCRGCGDEEVDKNEDSMEDCNLKEEGHGKKEDAKKKESSGAQEGRQVSKLTISEVFRSSGGV
jgi:hypothetical protein